MSAEVEVLAREAGRSGELVLRRSGADLEVILNGAFLISTANDASSRAMVAAALPHLAGDALEVLIGGLGLGYALDEALAGERVAHVTVAEYEPTIVRWFRAHGEGRAERAAAGERAARATIVVADVAELLAAHPEGFDLVSLDTDNGPGVAGPRGQRRPLFRGRRAARAPRSAARRSRRLLVAGPLRRRSSGRWPASSPASCPSSAFDDVQGRRHEYTMYVGLRDDRPGGG